MNLSSKKKIFMNESTIKVMPKTLSPFAQYLMDKFRLWGIRELDKGETKITISAFAGWLGFTQSAVSNWMTDNRTPTGDTVDLLADKLGLEVYDVLGMPRPHRQLAEIRSIYNALPHENQDELHRLVIEYAQKHNYPPQKGPPL